MMNIYNPGIRAAMRFDTGRASFNGMPLPTFGMGHNYGRSYANRTSKKPEKALKSSGNFSAPGYTFRWKPDAIASAMMDIQIGNVRPLPYHGAPPDAKPLEPGSPISMRPLKFEFVGVRVQRSGWSCVICVDFIVPDRKAGQPLQLVYNHAVLHNGEKHYMAEQTSIAIQKAFEHEIREMLYLGDKQFTNPHPETQQINF